MSKRCCMSNIRVFGMPVCGKKMFSNSPTFTPFCPLLSTRRGQQLYFHKLEFPFPKDASYQIWLKSVQWFWRRSHLKEKFTDVQWMGSDHYSSLEPSAGWANKDKLKVSNNSKRWWMLFCSPNNGNSLHLIQHYRCFEYAIAYIHV